MIHFFQALIFVKMHLMKKLFTIACLLGLATFSFAQKGNNYGKTVKTKKAIAVPVFLDEMARADSTWSGVVKGTVKEVCKREGCWLRLDDGSGNDILVKMKDHEFTVPKDIDGKTVYVMGTAFKTTTSVKTLKHYAEDAGKSQAEIDAITQPKTEIKLEATGVKIPE
jgi:hypothetical protein